MTNCEMGQHFIAWTSANTGSVPEPGLYHCEWCGIEIPIHEGIVNDFEEEKRLEVGRQKLYERMKQDYQFFHRE